MKAAARTIFACLFTVAVAGFPASLRAAEKAPNFIIIYEDDLGWADTSVSMMDGEPLAKSDFYGTPQLERLAARGMRFSNGYSPTPTCTGSRISIQFGKTSARMQYRNVYDVLSKKQRPDGWDDEISMAAVVKAADKNYITAHFGKGMGVRRMDHAGYDVTDEFDKGPNGNGHGHYIDVQKKIPIPDDNPKRIVDLTNRSVDFVKEHAGKRPFYLMVSHYAVHIPFQASPQAIEKCRQGWMAMARPATDKAMETECLYAAMIEESDANLGALTDELEKAGELDNTYIIFTSDNGSGHGWRDEVSACDLEESKSELGPLLHRRARHVISEMVRVPKMSKSLAIGDLTQVAEIMKSGHESLRDDYEVSCPELDLLVDAAYKFGTSRGLVGARMTGGGFGGSTVSLVREEAADALKSHLEDRFRSQFDSEPNCFITQITDGASAQSFNLSL